MTGVYFLKKGTEIVYIGKSKSVEDRLKTHHIKDYDSYRVIGCGVDKMSLYERRLINYFKPRHNMVGKNGYSIPSQFMEELRSKLSLHGMKLKDFSEMCGVPPTQLSQWMNGYRNPSTVAKFAMRTLMDINFNSPLEQHAHIVKKYNLDGHVPSPRPTLPKN